jgi:WD40 repeat protein
VGFSRHLPLAASAGMDGKLIIWDANGWTQRGVCDHHMVRSCGAWARGLRAGVGQSEGTRHIIHALRCCWLTPSLAVPCRRIQGVTRMAWHPTQPLVVTGCLDGVVRWWDLRTGSCVRKCSGHADAIQDVAVSPDGSMAVTGADDGTARVFTLATVP